MQFAQMRARPPFSVVDAQSRVYNKPVLNNNKPVLNNFSLALDGLEELSGQHPHQQSEEEITGEQFGIANINDIGHTGVQVGECEDNCNFRGVCSNGECFCQPGYYGKQCQLKKTSEKGTVSLMVLLLIGGACAAVSFIMMLTLLHLSLQSKRTKEKELGYAV
jgi:hypothetical protein